MTRSKECKIIILRKVPEKKQETFDALIKKMRRLANRQPGYVVSETLHNISDANDKIVISTWRSLQDWKAWLKCRDRIDIQEQLDGLLDEPTRYEIFENDFRPGVYNTKKVSVHRHRICT